MPTHIAVIAWALSASLVIPEALAQAGATLTSNGISADAPRKAVTRHEITIRGERIAYTATVADDIIAGEDGKPGAAIVTIAYARDAVADPGRRPVMFLFNGGPGASSSPLHMSALGPVRRVSGRGERGSADYADNGESPLDAFDLVFIDPVSTGFSRALPGVDPKQWYDGRRDALEVGRVIEDWLRSNGRESSPRYLTGESYGTSRVGLILKYCPQLSFDGVALVSGGENAGPGPNAVYIETLPSMTAGAYFYGKIDRSGRTVEQAVDEARIFAVGDYAAALARGKALSGPSKYAIAYRLSALTGLAVPLIEANELKVSDNLYMFNLLKDRNLRTGLLDVRVTSPLVANAAGAIDDPALGVTKPGAKGTAPPTAAAVGAVASPGVARYLHERLGFPAQDPYIGVNFTANVAWVWDPDKDTAGQIAARMKSDAHLRLFGVSGFYDLHGGADGSGFVREGVPEERLTFLQFAAGHEVYGDDANRARFADALRRFVRGP